MEYKENDIPLDYLIAVAAHFIEKIENHPEVKKLEYYPDMTIPDARIALEQLAEELAYRLNKD